MNWAGAESMFANKQAKEDRLIESQKYFRIFNYWRWLDLLSTVFAIIGLLLAIINYELDIRNGELDLEDPKDIIREGKSAMDMKKFKDPYTRSMRWAILATSMISLFCLVNRHQYKIRWINLYFNISLKRE